MSSEYSSDPPAYAEPATRTRSERRSATPLQGLRGTGGAIVVASFILVLVAGIVAVVYGLQLMDLQARTADSMVGVGLGAVVIVSALFIWQGRHEIGGIIAVVGGIVFLVLGPDTAGIFAVLGGILAIVSNRIVDVVA